MKKFLILAITCLAFNANALERYTIADIVDNISPAVVTVKSVENAAENIPAGNPFLKSSKQKILNNINRADKRSFQIGSGVLVDENGLVITNYHVVQTADKITISTQNNKFYDAKLLGFDEKSDLALLKINTTDKLTAVTFADSNKVRVGEFVIAIGNPYGLDGSVSTGIISARNRNIGTNIYDDFLQTDASINPGNSGGPLFNLDGEVIGINTAIFSKNGGSNGIGFAIPANTVRLIIKQLAQNGKVIRGWLGIQAQAIDQSMAKALELNSTNGVLVTNITANSPAETAGIKAGDVILKYNNQEIHSLFDLPKMVAETKINSQVKIMVLRSAKQVELTAKVLSTQEALKAELNKGVRIKQTKLLDLGVYVSQLTKNIKSELNIKAEQGVVITKVDPSFSKFNIKQGDIILQVDQTDIETVEELLHHIQYSSRKSLLFLVQRNGENTFSVVER